MIDTVFSNIIVFISIIFSAVVIFVVLDRNESHLYKLHYGWLIIGYILQIIYCFTIMFEQVVEEKNAVLHNQLITCINFLMTTSFAYKFLFFTEIGDLFSIYSKRILVYITHFLLSFYGYFCSYVFTIGQLSDNNLVYKIAQIILDNIYIIVPIVISAVSTLSMIRNDNINTRNIKLLVLNILSMVTSLSIIDFFNDKYFIVIIFVAFICKMVFDIILIKFIKTEGGH